MRLLLLTMLATLTGCSSPGLRDTGAVTIAASDELPAPSEGDLVRGARRHLIGPGDLISVEVFGLPELSRELRVDANGFISLPLAGAVSVIGSSPEELALLLQDRFNANFVREPRVSVGVVETVSQVVTLEGEVRKPGVYPVSGPMTLMRAIARAEGTTQIASTSRVVLFRTVEGRQMAALYDLRAIHQGAYRDPDVYPHDVIVVGQSQAQRIFPMISAAAGILLTPLVAILDNN
jgi:polysaccharide export outer membrane protein